MKQSSRGQRAFRVHMEFGALYIQQKKGLSDREIVEEIIENPYLQYLFGLFKIRSAVPN